MSRVLVIAAHPDDEILGVGGTVKKRSLNGDVLDCVILGEGATSRTGKRSNTSKEIIMSLHSDTLRACKTVGYHNVYFENLPDNRFDSVDLLDVIKLIEKYIKKIEPEVIYTHHSGDRNIDHRITFEAVLTACRPVGDYYTKEIYTFETPSSTEWGFMNGEYSFNPNVFEDISDTMQVKLEAMAEYHSELGQYPHPRSLEALDVIAKRWGTVVGKKYVEAFNLVRMNR